MHLFPHNPITLISSSFIMFLVSITPIMTSFLRIFFSCSQVCLFLKRGASQSEVDEQGHDPLSIAVQAANADIVTLWVLFWLSMWLLLILIVFVLILFLKRCLSFHTVNTPTPPAQQHIHVTIRVLVPCLRKDWLLIVLLRFIRLVWKVWLIIWSNGS